MAFIEINLDETPDTIPQLSVGEHTFEVLSHEEENDKNGDPVQIFKLKVDDEKDPDHGRSTFARFNFKYEPARVLFGHFIRSAGLAKSGQGVNAADLVSKRVKGIIKPNVYKDSGGNTVEATQIKDFLYTS